jgi:uncharacterized membrane protein
MKNFEQFMFFLANLLIFVCGLVIFAFNLTHCEIKQDQTALFIIALSLCGMLGALVYTTYKDYKRDTN